MAFLCCNVVTMESALVPMILDCDPGHDDALAILLAAGHPVSDLKLITTVAGNQTVDKTTYNARLICGAAGIDDVIIAAGCDAPLEGTLQNGEFIHGSSGLDGPELNGPLAEIDSRHAVEVMQKMLLVADRPITVVATGPMTNLATLLLKFPGLTGQISKVVFMGGSTGRGNLSAYTEFNIAVDPEAFEIVLNSGIPIAMCGLNLTHQAIVTNEVKDQFQRIDSPLSNLCIELMTFFAKTYKEVFGFEYPPLHDPVAVAVAIDPSVATFQRAGVAVELNGQYTRGATVVDLDDRMNMKHSIDVGIELDKEKFWRMMILAIERLSR